MWKERIAKVLLKAYNEYASEQGIEGLNEIKIDYPAKDIVCDYASPTAMESAKVFRKNPRQIAEGIIEKLDKSMFEKVECVGPGFINFTLSSDTLNSAVNEIVENADYGKDIVKEPEKMLLEYVSANPTGPLHIGHGRWAAIGDTLARCLNYAGHKAEREFYINDAGVQIKKLNASVEAVANGVPVPEDGYHGSYIKDLAEELKQAQANGDEISAKELIRKEQEELLSSFGVEFDKWFSEESLRNAGEVEKTIEELREGGYLYEKEGALWFMSTDFGDDKDRVLKKSDGEFTYFAVDIAYHKNKVARGYDRLINVLGADHHGYVARLNAAVEVLSKGKTKLSPIIGQLVRLFRGDEQVRMSKRTGDMISLQDVINEIGPDAVRLFLSMRSANQTLDFDLELAKKKDNENPVYYLQYAYARVSNIFLQLKEKGLTFNESAGFDINASSDEETRKLALSLIRFPDELLDVCSGFEVHRLAAYLYDTAAALHKFYYKNTVLDDNDDVRNSRLSLMRALRVILGIGFDLLGIEKKESM